MNNHDLHNYGHVSTPFPPKNLNYSNNSQEKKVNKEEARRSNILCDNQPARRRFSVSGAFFKIIIKNVKMCNLKNTF
jgi:hypothetical protein